MAIFWSSNGCRKAADDLLTSANRLESLLNEDLVSAINRGKNAYDSAAAASLFEKLDTLKANSSEFIDAIRRCSNYLTNTVAPAYEAVEKKTQNN